jgi:hypothetical protein
MSEKKRQKKDGEDKNKNNQRMCEANKETRSRNNIDTHEDVQTAGKSKE